MKSLMTGLNLKRVHQISYSGSSKFDAPLLRPEPEAQRPDRKETGRAFQSLITAAAKKSGRQRSRLISLRCPLIPQSSVRRQPIACAMRALRPNRRERKDQREHSCLRFEDYYP